MGYYFIPARNWEGLVVWCGSGSCPSGGRRAGRGGRRPEDPRSPRSASCPPAPGSPGCSDLRDETEFTAFDFLTRRRSIRVHHEVRSMGRGALWDAVAVTSEAVFIQSPQLVLADLQLLQRRGKASGHGFQKVPVQVQAPQHLQTLTRTHTHTHTHTLVKLGS